ncbi:winged helix-turn-helix domain-containing protein [Thalassotalea sp. ND16A]|uniref:winged helix-turn-helix domain-containing protein n=1 Tax=Thalassotalea sp. ND16A TaxID=1535422 RepID=UPI00051DE152|nr:winged helix-turn-helix domain-containing protein [Thalassotalea sp. ND16A]KGJ90536.1 putative transcriptional regulator, CadC [Thalassotalea sp. ND16A]
MRYLQFNDICIDTHNQQLYRGEETIDLAPKVYELLVFFCQNSQRLISKDELMECVWTGTIVTENAISRTLVKVRKVLADEPKNPQFIITVPRKGYRMVAEFSATDEMLNTFNNESLPQANNISNNISNKPQERVTQSTNLEKNTPAPSVTNKHKTHLLIIFMVLTLSIIFYALKFDSTTVVQTKAFKPLTRQVGIELYPAVSPNAAMVAYTKESLSKKRHINIENLSNHSHQSISHAQANISRPIWSPTTDKLAFLYQHNNVCMIYWGETGKLANSDNWQPISECSRNSNPYFVFSPDGKYLYFNDRQSKTHGYQVFRVNLSNNEKDIINQPITRGRGNYSFDISPNGESLVLLNSEFAPQTRIYTLDIASSTLTQTIQLPYLMRSVIWHHDNNSIIHPSPHPAFEIWQSSLAGQKLAVLASNTSRIKQVSRINNGEDYAFVSYLLNRDIHYRELISANLEPQSQPQQIVLDNSTVMDYLPALANNSSQYAFVSKRSTTAEVYLSNLSSNNSSQLTFFNDPVKLYQLAFSANDSQLMILADNQIFIAELSSANIRLLPLDNIAIAGASWQDEDNLIFSTIKNNDWQLMRYNISNNKLASLPSGYQGGLYSAIDQNYYFIANDSGQVLQFSSLNTEPQPIALSCQPSFIDRKLNLKLTDKGLVCLSNEKAPGLREYSFQSKAVDGWTQSPVNSDFDSNNNGVIFTQLTQSASDIMRTTSDYN